MRGGTLAPQITPVADEGLSPHARGNRAGRNAAIGVHGPIPACAGEPTVVRKMLRAGWAYPRMRGGTGDVLIAIPGATGLSPHARGNPCASR